MRRPVRPVVALAVLAGLSTLRAAADCGASGPGGPLTVVASGASYRTAPSAPAAPLTTGQAASLLLSGVDFGQSGGPLLFHHNAGIASDGTRLLLCDRNNNRVLVWKGLPSGNAPPDLVLGQTDLFANAPGSGREGMSWPVAVATDGRRVLVADAYNDRILVWTTFPTRNAQPADLVLSALAGTPPGTKASIRWPWGVWTDGTRVAVASTGDRSVLIWNRFPDRDGQPADLRLTAAGLLGTPRAITSDGHSLVVGDHNARTGGDPGNGIGSFVWRSFPAADDAPADFFLQDPHDARAAWLTGAYAPDGKLVLLGRSLHVWDGTPPSASTPPLLSVSPPGFTFHGGDGSAAVFASGRLFASAANANKVYVYDGVPTRADQLPDAVIGSTDACANTLEENLLVTNPVPATDGKSLFVSSDFDRRLHVWRSIPDEPGARPDFTYTLSDAVWDSALHGGRLVLAGQRSLLVWSRLPLAGELPDRTVAGPLGDATFSDVRGVALDDRFLYVSDQTAGKVWLFDGIPSAGSVPRLTLEVSKPTRLDSDGTWLAVTRTLDHTVTLYRVSDLAAGVVSPLDVPPPGRRLFNLPEGAALGDGRLLVADTGFNRVVGWSRVEDAIAGRDPDLVLGAPTLAPAPPAAGRDTLFWPGALALDGNRLWVGEFKFSGRLLRFGGESPAFSSGDLFVPAAASASGRGGSRWETTLSVTNEAWGSRTARLSFLPSGGDNRAAAEVPVAVPARTTLSLPDLVGRFLGSTGGGGVRLRVESGLSVASTTADAARHRGASVDVPALPASAALSSGRIGPLSHRPGDRTNAGLLNPGESPAAAELTLADASGTVLARQAFDVPPRGSVQWNDLFAAAGRAGVEVSGASLRLASTAPLFAWATSIAADGTTAAFHLASGSDRQAPQGAIVCSVTSQPASTPPGSICPRSSPTSASISRLSLSFIARTRSRCFPPAAARFVISSGSAATS